MYNIYDIIQLSAKRASYSETFIIVQSTNQFSYFIERTQIEKHRNDQRSCTKPPGRPTIKVVVTVK